MMLTSLDLDLSTCSPNSKETVKSYDPAMNLMTRQQTENFSLTTWISDLYSFPFQEKLKLVSVMGAGLLVGTALAVIIPEGVHTLYAAKEHGL